MSLTKPRIATVLQQYWIYFTAITCLCTSAQVYNIVISTWKLELQLKYINCSQASLQEAFAWKTAMLRLQFQQAFYCSTSHLALSHKYFIHLYMLKILRIGINEGKLKPHFSTREAVLGALKWRLLWTKWTWFIWTHFLAIVSSVKIILRQCRHD
jgi:hypothetical protein